MTDQAREFPVLFALDEWDDIETLLKVESDGARGRSNDLSNQYMRMANKIRKAMIRNTYANLLGVCKQILEDDCVDEAPWLPKLKDAVERLEESIAFRRETKEDHA